jgi:hypothetical protein
MVPSPNQRVVCTLGDSVLVGQVNGSANTGGFWLKVDGGTDAAATWVSTPPWVVVAEA